MNSLQRIQPVAFPVEKVVIPEAQTQYLENGIPVYTIEAGTEDIMRIEFTFRAGQVRETHQLLASTANMMLTEGSENYTSEELNRLLDFYGVFLNLSPEKDLAGVIFYFLSKHIDKVVELSKEILFRPVFPEPELGALMKKRLSWFLVNREKNSNVATDRFFEHAFGKSHPYGRQTVESDFEGLNRNLIKDFHSKFYTPGNMAIIISGKIHPETINTLNKYFGHMVSTEIRSENTENIPRGEPVKLIHIDKPESVQTSIRIGSKTINKRDPDYPGLKILNSILGGYFGSRLMKNIREEKGYTYGINSSVSSLNLTGYKVISTEVSARNCQKAIDEIYREIRLLQSSPVGKEEMAIVRNYMSGEMVRMFDGPFALAESFKSAWEYDLDNRYYYSLAEKIVRIDSDEITGLARKYFNTDELYQITVGSI